MQKRYLDKRDIKLKDYSKRSAKEEDYSILINEECVGYDKETGEIIFLHAQIGEDTTELVEALKSIQYQKSERSGGLVTNSRVFGYRPRITMRADFCSAASLTKDSPKAVQLLGKLALSMQKLYSEYISETFAKHKEVVEEKIKPEWLIKDTIFSSGIVNKNNQLRYHLDSGNFSDVFSCMLVLKGNGVEGGFLSIPSYDIGLELKNNHVLLFNGQNLLHGVTPIQRRNATAYRFSVVFYTLKTMWNCLPVSEEIERIKKRKTEREFRRAELTPEKKDAMREAFAKGEDGKQKGDYKI